MEQLLTESATKLAARIKAGEVSAAELVDASLARIERLEPQINAFTYLAADEAREAAAAVAPDDPRPFAGVPIAIKDNRAVAGMPLTMCSELWGDFRPRHDTNSVRRLKQAGFIVVGKTAMPENGILPTTESRRNGPTANPWDLTRTPGGSSGGSAAAVAAGMVPIAHGNDGGGSIRIPAACCGLVGLKAARGRVSPAPEQGQSFLVVDGVLSRDVADTAAVLDLLEGYEPGDANWAPPPARPYAEIRRPSALRIGLALNPPLDGATLEPECERATLEAGRLLEELGHRVEPVEPPWSGLDLLPDFTRAFGPGIAMTVAVGARLAGREPSPEDVEPLTWQMYENATGQNVLAYMNSQGRLELVARQIVQFLEPYDALLTPALASPPVRTGEIHGRGPEPWENYRRSGHFTPYTAICNVTGQPAISLPLFEDGAGLPLAVQLIGPPLREDLVLGLAAQLEEARPWAARSPQL